MKANFDRLEEISKIEIPESKLDFAKSDESEYFRDLLENEKLLLKLKTVEFSQEINVKDQEICFLKNLLESSNVQSLQIQESESKEKTYLSSKVKSLSQEVHELSRKLSQTNEQNKELNKKIEKKDKELSHLRAINEKQIGDLSTRLEDTTKEKQLKEKESDEKYFELEKKYKTDHLNFTNELEKLRQENKDILQKTSISTDYLKKISDLQSEYNVFS